MLFFGGFGSMFPYLIYLSIVWICVLVGMRGNIGSFFNQSNDNQQLTISSEDDNFDDENLIALFSIEQSISENTVQQEEIRFSKIPDNDTSPAHKIYLFKITNSPTGNYTISRRGPPVYS